MPVAHLIRFKTSKSADIQTQLRAYVERELDRKPPRGFLSSRILAATDGKSVAFYTEWDDAETLDDTRDSAPWEACMDLNDIHADGRDETTYEIS
ncbi:MAG: hypothetical protein K8R18_16780 [Parvibaculum sp.]|uniref:hypothetical protein n=1 Tax=Parvibaculum sp. TaxID=2024848 RepID=UPI0025EC271A|nr:hypothetical protein [Parvibaculum sp.]MCE9651277.1 hypothetical protein [Parvibaculum sp.]